MKEKPQWFYQQSGVIPFRRFGKELEIILVTSRGGKRWICPKGVIEPDLSARDSAAKEAFEEAGVEGQISTEPIGEYVYKKWGGTCHVTLFAMKVTKVLDDWPESDMREREWFTIKKAATLLKESQLIEIIQEFPQIIKHLSFNK